MSCHLPAVRPHGAVSVQRSSGGRRYTEIYHVTYLLYGHMVQSRYRGHLGDVVTLRYVMSHVVRPHGAVSVQRSSGGRRYTEICHVTYMLYGHMVQSLYRGPLGDVVTLRYVMSLTCCTATWCSLGTEVIWGHRYTEICHVTYLLYGHMVQSLYRGPLGDVVTLRYVMSLTCCTATWCSLGTEVIWGTSLH